MMWFNEEDDAERFVHIVLNGSDFSTPELTLVEEDPAGNLFEAAVDPHTGKPYYFYSESFSPNNFLIAFDESGQSFETEIPEIGILYGARTLHVNNGYLSLVTASESRGKIYITHGRLGGSGTPSITANFSASSTEIKTGEQVFFTDESSGEPDSWNWTFEGGIPSNSTEQNPVVVYETAGEYSVTLEVSDGESSDTITHRNYIKVKEENTNPVATLIWDFEEETLENFQAQQAPDFDVGGSIEITSGQVYEGDFAVKLLADTEYRLAQMINYSNLAMLEEDGTFLYRFLIPSEHLDDIDAVQPFVMHGNDWTWNSNTLQTANLEADTWHTAILTIPAPDDGFYQAFGIELMGSGDNPSATPEIYVDFVEYFEPGAYTNTEKQPETVENFSLSQNYPNPFNPTTQISYQIPEAASVKLEVFDMMGRKITTLVNGRKSGGIHHVRFDASHLSSGIYIYRITAGEYIHARKMLLLK